MSIQITPILEEQLDNLKGYLLDYGYRVDEQPDLNTYNVSKIGYEDEFPRICTLQLLTESTLIFRGPSGNELHIVEKEDQIVFEGENNFKGVDNTQKAAEVIDETLKNFFEFT